MRALTRKERIWLKRGEALGDGARRLFGDMTLWVHDASAQRRLTGVAALVIRVGETIRAVLRHHELPGTAHEPHA